MARQHESTQKNRPTNIRSVLQNLPRTYGEALWGPSRHRQGSSNLLNISTLGTRDPIIKRTGGPMPARIRAKVQEQAKRMAQAEEDKAGAVYSEEYRGEEMTLTLGHYYSTPHSGDPLY